MIDFIKMLIVLALIGIATTFLYSFTNTKVSGTINELQVKNQLSLIKEILPEGVLISEKKMEISGTTHPYWVGFSNSDTFYVFRISNEGYAGTLDFLISIGNEGIIRGIHILDQHEIPGMGARMQEIRHEQYIWNNLQKKPSGATPWFCDQFTGINVKQTIYLEKRYGEWFSTSSEEKAEMLSHNAVSAITGSTISTRAIISGIETKAKSYFEFVQEHANDH